METGDNHCDECGSPFIPRASAMAGLCAECAPWLYGYPACAHDMADGHCRKCGWDGTVSAYVASLKSGTD